MENKIYECKHNDVVILARQRTKINEKELKELCSSIEKHGQLQPGVCRLDEDQSPVLIVGRRRLRACESLGINFKYTLKEDIQDETVLKELELAENLYRENLSWQDRVEAILELHELWQKAYGVARAGSSEGHGVRNTARKLHLSVGNTQEDLELAMFAREIPEVKEANNKTIAKNIVRRIKEDIRREDALDKALEVAQEKRNELEQTSISIEGESSQEVLPFEQEVFDHPTDEGSDQPGKQELRILDYDRRSIEGRLEDCAEDLSAESFDCIIFDPPWGVEHDKVKRAHGKDKEFDDSKEIFDQSIEGWLNIVFDLMGPSSHLYLFFPITRHEQVYTLLESVGFTVNRMPIFWKKRGAHHTRNPKVWPGRCYEAIAYARKGSKDLAVQGQPDIIETSPPTQKMKGSHPNAKHPDIYRDLLKRSCTPGERVLDPMSGSGMFGVACESLRTQLALDWYQIEKDEDYRTLGIFNLTKGYGEIVAGEGDLEKLYGVELLASQAPNKRRELPPLPEDYKSLEPGGEEWKRYWKVHPEQQEEMLEWRAKQS